MKLPRFLATIRDRFKTSQAAVDYLVKGVDQLLNKFLDILNDSFVQKCSKFEGYLTVKHVTDFLNSFKDQSLFEGVNTCRMMESYLRDHSKGRKVLLEKVILSRKTVIRKGVPKTVPEDFGYYVPFQAQLEQVLNCPDVLHCVANPVPYSKGSFENVTHGYFYKHHPVVKEHGQSTLCFEIHVDDVETCAALKSKTNKHNLRLFYWKLGNLHPDKKSSLKAINLLAIVKSKVAKKWGNDHFLRDFVKVMTLLGTVGLDLKINGTLSKVFGILLLASADNPASANLGGFKETHCALRPCRMCMVLSEDLCKEFRCHPDLLRNLQEHEAQLKEVLGPEGADHGVDVVPIYEDDDDNVEEELLLAKYADHKNPSINYGINRKSILSDAPGFDVTKCLPQDLMHVLPEGVCDLLCRVLLKDACFPAEPTQQPGQPQAKRARVANKNVLKLDDVNNIIQNLADFGHLNNSTPSRIEQGHVKGEKMRQSAAQMLVLIRVMPFILLNKLPEEKLQLLCKFLELMDVCLAFKLTLVDVTRMELLVQEFGSEFKRLYPNVKTLKLHVLVHLGMQTRLLGPPRLAWCFRYEAMHSEFTSLVPVVRSKKDIAFSTAKRHLSKRNKDIMEGQKSGSYLTESDIILGGEEIVVSDLPDCVSELVASSAGTAIRIKKLIRSGQAWQEGTAILLEKKQENSVFGRIHSVYKFGTEIFFVYHEYSTTLVRILHAFQVDKIRNEQKCVKISDICDPFPVPRFSFHFPGDVKVYLIHQTW